MRCFELIIIIVVALAVVSFVPIALNGNSELVSYAGNIMGGLIGAGVAFYVANESVKPAKQASEDQSYQATDRYLVRALKALEEPERIVVCLLEDTRQLLNFEIKDDQIVRRGLGILMIDAGWDKSLAQAEKSLKDFNDCKISIATNYEVPTKIRRAFIEADSTDQLLSNLFILSKPPSIRILAEAQKNAKQNIKFARQLFDDIQSLINFANNRPTWLDRVPKVLK